MYISHNDYELVYLIKEGCIQAKELLFEIYGVLIKKIHREGFYYNKYPLLDFLQEGLLILEKVIYNYNIGFSYSFYNYFILCFSRRLARLHVSEDIMLCEKRVKYKFIDTVDVKTNSVRKLIERAIEDEDEISKKLIYECFLENLSIQSFCVKYNLDYAKTYYAYRKIRFKLEKILTN